MPSTLRRWLVVLIALAALLALGSQLRAQLGIDFDVESVRDFAESLGPMGPLIFVGVVALRGFLALPSQVVLIAAGLCFGTTVGTMVGGAGLMLSGLGIFLAARYAGRSEIEKRFGRRLGRLLDASGHGGGAAVLAIGSGYPISPLSPLHAAAGLTSMTVGLFVVAAFVGGLIRASIFAYFGNAMTEASHGPLLYGTLAAIVILAIPFGFPRGRAWLRTVFGPETASVTPSPTVPGTTE
jgi:uncharacterized membrane protein YdjX (TVP38/TMEM64 family)